NCWRNVIERIGSNVRYDTLMRTDTMAHFAAYTQPIGWINVDKRTRLTAELCVLQAMNIVITFEEKLAGKSHAEAIIVNQGERYVVISRREASGLSLPTQRDQRLGGKTVLV